ncbi:putative enoyl-[acyl-carrier-protein] reductase II [Bacteriovorax sp. BSW11_IV]|uniref:NAD(P)H-dependent flavin oxidoreductase n=1 Tax=Bacteriovorax sp. BSW11_IV TaxID=1353529 RepID=UPI00038A1C85|nr:nitronate monooxygenase [Bacteriovorax sp. BSW11_IV]EQC49353.1 putative enoyl-[acyl-carrier-protein] reductase II [Bacteriovorax sp. BSW11_IV]
MTRSPFPKSPITDLFGIQYPIIQAGMVWVSGAKLAAAASNAGCLGLIGAGSMKPDLLRSQIQKAKKLTSKPFGVNIPLLYHLVEEQINVCLEEGVKIFFTSAGSPKKWTQYLKDHGAIVVHVTSTPELAKKCEEAGCDAVVVEGFEAGGHNGRDEITTMCLIPQVVDSLKIPVIAAGGIGDGRAILASFALGADAVQLGTRFALTIESSAHDNFKKAIQNAKSGDTKLVMKQLVPVRLLKNKFYDQVIELENRCATNDEMNELLGKGRAKAGMLEGNMDMGELEIGQVSALLKDIPTCEQLVQDLISEYHKALTRVS